MPFVVVFASPGQRLVRLVVEVAILCVCASLALNTARAQDDAAGAAAVGSRDAPAEALDHYNRGRAHYHAGRYEEAVVELERALSLDPGSPNLVYNLARVYELLGDIERAISYYARYRSMLPVSELSERERVSGTIERLQGAKERLARRPRPSPAPPPRVTTERGVADGAFWTLASLSIAALAAGTATGALALRAERDSRRFVLGLDGDLADRQKVARRADRLALVSDVSFAAGALGGLTSILLYALRTKAVLEPTVALEHHGLTLGLRGAL
jgi:tetratricopeptide (TPR) repeat protein